MSTEVFALLGRYVTGAVMVYDVVPAKILRIQNYAKPGARVEFSDGSVAAMFWGLNLFKDRDDAVKQARTLLIDERQRHRETIDALNRELANRV
jgi:hypothetical protein